MEMLYKMMLISLLFSLLKQRLILNYNQPALIASLRKLGMGAVWRVSRIFFNGSLSVI
jgi:hypothetical protein